MSTPTLTWIKQDSSFNTSGDERHPVVRSDADCNLYVGFKTTGYFSQYSGNTTTGSFDTAIAKFNSAGTLQWLKQSTTFNTTSIDINPTIAVHSSSGDVYCAYNSTGTVTGGTASGGSSDYDIIVYKLNTSGVLQWTRQLTSFNTTADDLEPSIDVDSNGNLYVAYYTSGTVSGQTNSGGIDIAIFKMNSSGTVVWTKQVSSFDTVKTDTTPSLRVTSAGIVYVAYSTLGTISGQQDTGSNDICVLKLDTDGNQLWIKKQNSFNTSVADTVPVIATNSMNDVYVAYMSAGTSAGNTHVGGQDIVVFKLDEDGVFQWVKQSSLFNTTAADSMPAIWADNAGGCYVTYYTSGTVAGQTSSGNDDIVVFKLDTSGNHQWTLQNNTFNTTSSDGNPYPASIHVTNCCSLVFVFETNGAVIGKTNTGGKDIVIAKYAQSGSYTCGDPYIRTLLEGKVYKIPNIDNSVWPLLTYTDATDMKLTINASIKHISYDSLPTYLYNGMKRRNKETMNWLKIEDQCFYDKLMITYGNTILNIDIDTLQMTKFRDIDNIIIRREKKAYKMTSYADRKYPVTATCQYMNIKVLLPNNEFIEFELYSDVSTDDRSNIILSGMNVNHAKLGGGMYTINDLIEIK